MRTLTATTETTETSDMFGRKFVAVGEIETAGGLTAPVVSVWMLPDGVPRPQLVTAYPAR
jgi:hypothetical protein